MTAGSVASPPILDITDLSYSYGDHVALTDVHLTIRRGEICALLGPNGAGKTTMLSIVAGLRRPGHGSVQIDGQPAGRTPSARSRVGFVPQEIGVYKPLTCRANLALFGELNGLRRRALAQRIDHVAGLLEITDLLDRQADALSGGQQRRLHTAMALIHSPPLVLLDEPTAGVDVASRHRLLAAVRHLAEVDGVAIVYTTHYLSEIDQLAPRVVIISDGNVVADGNIADLRTQFATPMIEISFSGAAPTLPSRWQATADGTVVRVPVANPSRSLSQVIADLGTAVADVVAIEIHAADTESIYSAVVGGTLCVPGREAR